MQEEFSSERYLSFCFFVSSSGLQLRRKVNKVQEEEHVAITFSSFDKALDLPGCFLSARQLKLNKPTYFLIFIHEFYVLIILYAIRLFSFHFFFLLFISLLFLPLSLFIVICSFIHSTRTHG